MKTKYLLNAFMLTLVITLASPLASFATEPKAENAEVRIEQLTNRLNEIKSIDKSTLSKEEKKALRGEVKAIKKEMKVVSGGVYISIGAILLIALLIILLA